MPVDLIGKIKKNNINSQIICGIMPNLFLPKGGEWIASEIELYARGREKE